MSSRGFLIGQIIDDLDGIASQVRTRCAVGQNDLNRLLEDFFKDIINRTRGLSLVNLNTERSNEPGLDLGDAAARVAFQITSRADKGKIESTLKAITREQETAYDKIYIFIIGDRKSKYNLNKDLAAKTRFGSKNIIDITDLCREIMSVEITIIQAIHRKIADEQARVRIELEPRLSSGYKTKASDFIEQIPEVQRSDATLLAGDKSTEGLYEDASEAQKSLDAFIAQLRKLPRITREFLGWMYDHAAHIRFVGGESFRINIDLVERKANRLPSVDAELRLLREFNFVYYDEPDEPGQSAHFTFGFPGAERTDLSEAFRYYTRAHKISVEEMYSTMNFTPFGPAPSVESRKPSASPTTTKVQTKKRKVR